MKSLKEWYSAKELEGFDGLPNIATNITRKAKIDNWLKRERAGVRGGGYEYHISSFPLEIQQQLGFTATDFSEFSDKYDFMQEENLVDDDLEKIDDFREILTSAGLGCFNEEMHSVPKVYVEKAWLKLRGFKASDCAMFKVAGNSMYPTLKDGEDIIVNRKANQLKDGEIFVLNHRGVMWVKKVQVTFEGVELLSDNHEYRAIKLNHEEANSLIVIGKVVRSYRNF